MNPVFLLTAVLALAACTTSAPPTTSPATTTLRLDNQTYLIQPLTASTWTATPQNPSANPVKHRAELLKAIETTSGCKVTDSDYSEAGRQLDAQVDCGSSLRRY